MVIKSFLNIFNLLFQELSSWVIFIILKLPNGPISNRLRNKYWQLKLNLSNKTIFISRNCMIYNEKKLIIGNNFFIGENSIIDVSDSLDSVYIGDDVLIAGGFFLRASNHNYKSTLIPIRLQSHSNKKFEYKNNNYTIVIEDDVWIGQNVIVTSGVKIGKGAVIGAGSVIRKDVDDYSIILGSSQVKINSRI